MRPPGTSTRVAVTAALVPGVAVSHLAGRLGRFSPRPTSDGVTSTNRGPIMHAAPSATSYVRAPRGSDSAEALQRGRRRLLIAGALAILLGVAAILVPAIASVTTAIFIGWVLVFAAIYHVIDAFSVEHGG